LLGGNILNVENKIFNFNFSRENFNRRKNLSNIQFFEALNFQSRKKLSLGIIIFWREHYTSTKSF
jgi:hypothetical protein